jgi:hypothetical protein
MLKTFSLLMGNLIQLISKKGHRTKLIDVNSSQKVNYICDLILLLRTNRAQ